MRWWGRNCAAGEFHPFCVTLDHECRPGRQHQQHCYGNGAERIQRQRESGSLGSTQRCNRFFQSPSTTSSSTLTLTASNTATLGNATVTATGTSGTLSQTAKIDLTVAVPNVTVSLSPKQAAVAATSQTQQFTATVTGNTSNLGVTWSVDGTAGGSATAGTISASGLYTPPATGGIHTITATSVANSADSASVTVAVTDLAGVFTHHNDLSRDGTNTQEYALTPSNVNTTCGSSKPHALARAFFRLVRQPTDSLLRPDVTPSQGSARDEGVTREVLIGTTRVDPDRHGCRSLGRDGVTMMQSAKSREGVNLAFHRRTYRCWPTCWGILRECEVRPIFMVVANILGHQPLEVPLLQDDHVVQQISSTTPDPALRDTVLPRTPKGSTDGLASHIFRRRNYIRSEL